MENEKDSVESLPSTETVPVVDTDYTVLIEQVEKVNVKLDTLCNISIILLVGLGVVLGVLCSNVFSRYIRV